MFKINMKFRVFYESKVFMRAIVSERALVGELIAPVTGPLDCGWGRLSRSHFVIYGQETPRHLQNPVIPKYELRVLRFTFAGTY